MSNRHKNPTISFRITDAERKQIEARILASGMMKKDYFVRSCIYNRICVVGKKETIYPLVQTVNALYLQLLEMQKAFTAPDTPLSSIPARTQFLLSVAKNVIHLLSLMTRLILYIYTGWQKKHLYYMPS